MRQKYLCLPIGAFIVVTLLILDGQVLKTSLERLGGHGKKQ